MPVQIRRVDLYSYVINALERDIGSFKQALEAHAATVDEPAPIAVHTLVEAIARSPDGAFIVAEDVAEAERDKQTYITLDEHNLVLARVTALEKLSPAPGQLDAMNARIVELEGYVTVQKASLALNSPAGAA